MISIKRPVM